MTSLLEKEAIQKQIGDTKLFGENLGATIDLQHGLVAELEAKAYNIDYKDVASKKENARELSRVRRELSSLEKEFRKVERKLEELESQLDKDNDEDKNEEEAIEAMNKALDQAERLMASPQFERINDRVIQLAMSAIQKSGLIELLGQLPPTKIQLVGDKVLS